MKQEGYLIIDVGTGNVRVAVTDVHTNILHVERDNVHYLRDDRYPDALHFEPDKLWEQILTLIQKTIKKVDNISVLAVTASSQREGIVLLDSNGKSLIGLPNHDHRGREWEYIVQDKNRVYQLTGRYPSSLFSALKLVGIRERRPEIYRKVAAVLSISDWVQFMLSGIMGYEHAQASETILYDVENKQWLEELCTFFSLDPSILPPLKSSGTILGTVLPEYIETLPLPAEAVVVVGGADTQLAIKSTGATLGDIVIVSGTTTPITKLVNEYITDAEYRSWTNRYSDDNYLIVETNAGVTGLNFQRLKKIFYPNDSYDTVEKEMSETNPASCIASLGSLIADEKKPILTGGFVFPIPVGSELSRGSFMRATLWDIACCIKRNFEILEEIAPDTKDFVWACGGGFQSATLRSFVATLIGKPLKIRKGYQQASVIGGAIICNEALEKSSAIAADTEIVYPDSKDYNSAYKEWQKVRESLKNKQVEALV